MPMVRRNVEQSVSASGLLKLIRDITKSVIQNGQLHERCLYPSKSWRLSGKDSGCMWTEILPILCEVLLVRTSRLPQGEVQKLAAVAVGTTATWRTTHPTYVPES